VSAVAHEEEMIASALYRALKASSPSACVEPPYVGAASIIDGNFDWGDVAHRLRSELQGLGLEVVVAALKAE
jgi:hypothetical protein